MVQIVVITNFVLSLRFWKRPLFMLSLFFVFKNNIFWYFVNIIYIKITPKGNKIKCNPQKDLLQLNFPTSTF